MFAPSAVVPCLCCTRQRVPCHQEAGWILAHLPFFLQANHANLPSFQSIRAGLPAGLFQCLGCCFAAGCGQLQHPGRCGAASWRGAHPGAAVGGRRHRCAQLSTDTGGYAQDPCGPVAAGQRPGAGRGTTATRHARQQNTRGRGYEGHRHGCGQTRGARRPWAGRRRPPRMAGPVAHAGIRAQRGRCIDPGRPCWPCIL